MGMYKKYVFFTVNSQICRKQIFLMSTTHYANKMTTELNIHNTWQTARKNIIESASKCRQDPFSFCQQFAFTLCQQAILTEHKPNADALMADCHHFLLEPAKKLQTFSYLGHIGSSRDLQHRYRVWLFNYLDIYICPDNWIYKYIYKIHQNRGLSCVFLLTLEIF